MVDAAISRASFDEHCEEAEVFTSQLLSPRPSLAVHNFYQSSLVVV